MNTITKAIIKHKVVDSNKYYVEIPYLQQSSVNNNGITESELEATLAHTPGIINSYNEGDVVFVGFEDTLTSKPVILGKLLLDENENRGFAKLDSLDVTGKVKLSKDVTIGNNTIDELLTNAVNSTTQQITSIDGLSGGTLTSALRLTGSNPNNASIVLESGGQLIDDSSSNYCVLGRYQGNFIVNAPTYPLRLRGSESRPQYNTNDIALYSDIATTALPNFTKILTYVVAGGTQANKFLSINYSGYGSESAAYFKMSAASCHGNGTSYQFLEDILIGCSKDGAVTCKLYKYCQSTAASPYATYNYGDVFYVIDTTNKIVDFYILCGQYSHSYYTPFTKIGNTTTSGITQYTSTPVVYSSGDKVWADGISSLIARESDIRTKLYKHVLNLTGNTGQMFSGNITFIDNDSTPLNVIYDSSTINTEKQKIAKRLKLSIWFGLTAEVLGTNARYVDAYVYTSGTTTSLFLAYVYYSSTTTLSKEEISISADVTDTVTPL